MYKMMFYNLAIKLLKWSFSILAALEPKAARRMKGLKAIEIPKKRRKRIWIHCASAGEYEQAIPLVRQLRSIMEVEILISFFSPSGMEHAQKFPEGDFYYYLPFDHTADAAEFVKAVDADVAIWVKYEFWRNMLKAIHATNIPIYLINADLQGLQLRRGIYGSIIRECLPLFRRIYAVSEGFNDLSNIIVVSDSKWQQAKANTFGNTHLPELNAFIAESPCIVCGSVHEDDLKLINPLLSDSTLPFKWIIVPHETDDKSISKTLNYLPHRSFSLLSKGIASESEILVVDQKGVLKFLYRYATIAYVGGGFGKAVHNVLEPAAYGIPVVSGPNIEGIPETKLLLHAEVLHLIQSSDEFRDYILRASACDLDTIKDKIFTLFEDQIKKGFTQQLADRIAQDIS